MPSSLVLAISCMPRQTPSTGVPRFRTASFKTSTRPRSARRDAAPWHMHRYPLERVCPLRPLRRGPRTALPRPPTSAACLCTDPRLPIPWSTMMITLVTPPREPRGPRGDGAETTGGTNEVPRARVFTTTASHGSRGLSEGHESRREFSIVPFGAEPFIPDATARGGHGLRSSGWSTRCPIAVAISDGAGSAATRIPFTSSTISPLPLASVAMIGIEQLTASSIATGEPPSVTLAFTKTSTALSR